MNHCMVGRTAATIGVYAGLWASSLSAQEAPQQPAPRGAAKERLGPEPSADLSIPAGSAAEKPLTEAQGKELLVERNRLRGDVTRLFHANMSQQARQQARQQASQLLHRVLEIERQVLGPTHDDVLATLGAMARVQTEHGAWQAAERIREEILVACRTRFGLQHWRTTDAQLAVKDVQRWSRLMVEQRLDLARASRLRAEGTADFRQGRYAAGIEKIASELEIQERILGPDHPETAICLNNLGQLYWSLGDYGKAELFVRRALAIYEMALGSAHHETASSLDYLASIYAMQGNYARAEPLHRRALKIMEEAMGPEHRYTAMIRANLASTYYSMGDYAKAEPLHRRALEINEKSLGRETPDTAISLYNLGNLYRSMGDSAKAEPLLRRALSIYEKTGGPDHPETATSLNTLGSLYLSRGDYRSAETLFRRALEIREKALGLEHRSTAGSLNNLGALYQSMGESEKAVPFYRRALEINAKVLGPEHPETAACVNNLGCLFASLGDYAMAGPLFRRALAIQEKALGPEHPNTAGSVNNLGHLYQSMGDYPKAEPFYRRALEIIVRNLEATSVVQSERQQLAMSAGLAGYLDNWLSVTSRTDTSAGDVWFRVLGWKGAVLARQRAARMAGGDPAVAPLFTELQSVTMRLATHSRSFPAKPDLVPAWRQRMDELQEAQERLEAELSAQSRVFREARQQVTLAELREALPADAALVDFLEYTRDTPPTENGTKWTSERSLLAFVVRREGPVMRLELGPVAPIAAAIDVWRASFGRSSAGQAAGRDLRVKLWEPLLPHLQEADTVLVSSDGALGRLPLIALPGRRPDSFLIEDHRIALLAVPRLLPELMATPPRTALPERLLLLGDVDYGGAANAPPQDEALLARHRGTDLVRGKIVFPPLPGTNEETNALAKLFGDVTGSGEPRIVRLQRTDATERRFGEESSRCGALHLATHGFFAPPDKKSAFASDTDRDTFGPRFGDDESRVTGFNPNLLSGLAFAGANRPPQPDQDDGILTAEEIAFLPLGGVDLVTLSACETGLGAVAGGEGLLGCSEPSRSPGRAPRSPAIGRWTTP